MKKLVLVFCLLVVYCGVNDNSGVIEDTDTGIVVYMDDGKTPAEDAMVKFVPYDYAQKINLKKVGKIQKVWEVQTDSNGTFTLP